MAPVSNRGGLATLVVRALDAAGVSVDDVELRQPSLDDVFFVLTGRPAESGDGNVAAGGTDDGQAAAGAGTDHQLGAFGGPGLDPDRDPDSEPGSDLQEVSI
jgi:hypothetical protein